MPLSQLQGLTPLGGTPNYGVNSTSSNADGTDPNDPNAQKRRATFQRAPSGASSDGSSAQPQQRTFAQMSQQGIARPAPPTMQQTAAPAMQQGAAPQVQFQAPAPAGATVSTQPVGPTRSPIGIAPTDINPAGQLPLTAPLQAAVGMQNNPPRSAVGIPPTDTNPSGQLPLTPPLQASVGMQNNQPTTAGGAPSALKDAVMQAVLGGMSNPSSYNSDTVKQIIDAENQQLALDQTAGRRSIDETMAARGLYDSTAAGDKYGQLEKEQDAQRAQLDATLAANAAQTYGADRTAAVAAGSGLQSQLANQGLAQQAQDLNSALGYGNLTGTVNGAPTLAAQQLSGQLGLGYSQIDASLLNSERSQLGGIASAGLLSDNPVTPDSSWINFITGGQVGAASRTVKSALDGTSGGAQVVNQPPSSLHGAPTSPTTPTSPTPPVAPTFPSPGVPTAPGSPNAPGGGLPSAPPNDGGAGSNPPGGAGAPITNTSNSMSSAVNSALGYGNPSGSTDQLAQRGYRSGQTFRGDSGVTITNPDPTAPGSGYVTVGGQSLRIMGTSAAGLGPNGQPREPVPGVDHYWLQGADGQMVQGPVIGSEYQQFMNYFNGPPQ